MKIKNIDETANKQITEVLGLVRKVLGENILGVYLCGSAMLGGLQKYSDIDLFAISKRATTEEEKKRLVERLLIISAKYPPTGSRRSIELTIALQPELKPWKYPPRFDFRYGDWMRKDFEKGSFERCKGAINPDLAIIITQVMLRGVTLLGSPPDQLIDAVPYKDFMKAISEISDLVPELEDDTRNVLLTLARIWHTLETDSIGSKQSSAGWVLERLPEGYKPVVEHALAACLGQTKEDWEKIPRQLIKECADYLINEIHRVESGLDYDKPGKRITVLSS